MKKSTALFLFIQPFIFAGTFLPAQSVLPLLEEGKTWHISESLNYGATTTKTYALGSDTIIENVTWTRLLKSWEENPAGWGLSGLIREESNGKVYFKPLDYNGGFGEQRLIYNFGASVGETFTVYGFHQVFGEEVEIDVLVSSIDTVTIEGVTRRRFFLESQNFYGEDCWIEGIGSEQGFLISFSFYILIDIWEELLCVKADDELLYMGPMETCYINTVGVLENQINQGISIYPNPASASFYISVPELMEETVLNIFDLCGKIVFTTEIHAVQQLITHNLPPGTYIYRISSTDGPASDGKLVIR